MSEAGPMRIVLWDVDGTLLLNNARAGMLYHQAFKEGAGVDLGAHRSGEHGKTDGQIISERLAEQGADPGLLAAVATRLDELSTEEYLGAGARDPAPGVADALRAVAAAGWTNGLLTGNSPTRARVKLQGAGLDVDAFDWEHSYFGDRALVRADVTIAAREHLDGATAVIIGDTPSDGLAADAVGFPFLAVATGIFDEPTLEETSARVVVADLVVGLSRILAALEAVSRAPAGTAP
jgi:phosphoglycolate phosphatase